MAVIAGEAFISVSLQVAFERLASSEMFNFFRGRKLKDGLLKKLHIILISVNQVIEDAEERQYRNPNVKKWLDELKDEVFKAEDLLDEIATEASRQKLNTQFQTVTSKVRGFFTFSVNSFDKEIESRIQEVLDNLEYLIKQNEILGLQARFGAGTEVGVKRKLFKRLPTSSLIDESNICGRDAEKENIIEKLSSHSGNQPVNVIAIAGMGGMGKTTLARIVYEDKRVKDQFQLRAWLTISQESDVLLIIKAILQALDHPTKDSDNHQLKLKETLMGKKFFLVFDDVWNENHTMWEVLQAPFNYGASGSKILVTTRNKKVAEVMHSTHIHLLKQLQDEDCWKLFAKHAFNDQHNVTGTNLVSIGREIVKKCGGLPLAIKTLGSLLHTKLSSQEWIKILESDIWHLSENDSNIIPSLRLSYHYLPSNLKRYFAYCSIFPKDYEIDKDVLIQLWMAEGLLHSNQKGKTIEEVGNEVFNDLESRSFFEPSKSGNDYFVMHDLVNDLAKSVMGEFCLWPEGDQAQDIPIKTRYFSYLGTEDHILKYLEAISKCNQLRSFMPFQLKHTSFNYIKGSIMHDLLSRLACLKYMRVLSLNGYRCVKKLTNDIGNLKHLRYLDLSHTQIKKLPDSICSMINLHTLKLKGCLRLIKLPSDLPKLINLCHLDLEGSGIKKMPKYMGKLNHLETMTQFVAGKNKGYDLKELGALNRLRGTLIISKLENIIDPMNARDADIKDKHLDKLELYWGLIKNHEVSQDQEHILEALQPNCGVKELIVCGYGATKFPNWFDGLYLPNVVSLHLSQCTSCIKLPPLGLLPFLEKLEISGFDGLKVIGHEFYGNDSSCAPFRSLLHLTFLDLKQWKEWNLCYEGDSFPCLEELHIMDCPRLTKSLPQHLPSLKKLKITKCENLETSPPKASSMFLRSCKKMSLKEMPTCSLTDVGTCTSGVNESFMVPPIQSLMLVDCPAMESLPQGGLLSSLRYLSISSCPKLIASHKNWGLHDLLSLEEIVVGDHDFENVESFPEEGLLPPNVQSLTFLNCLKLKAINYRALLHFQSLKFLIIWNCPSLSFESLPEEGLPKSLCHLKIRGKCPLLKQRCQEEKGQDWPKISHIPHIDIDAY